MSKQRIIKKYANRRLYDMSTKKYITLSDVKQLVCDNIDFRVMDAGTKKDITSVTLLQIIAEQENGPAPLFTTALLRHFIRFYDQPSHHVFKNYLEQAMQSFDRQKTFFTDSWSAYQQFLKQTVKK